MRATVMSLAATAFAAVLIIGFNNCSDGGSSGGGGSSNLAPASGPVGTLLTLTGTAFTGLTNVTVGGTSAVIVSSSSSTATVLVMPGSTTGSVTATTSSGTTSLGTFTVSATGAPATQQGSKILGSGYVGAADFGEAVALSADGNTALVGGWNDNSGTGAAWVYTRSGTTWTQQGGKLIGTGAVATPAYQGIAVALSADGNTAAVSGYGDNNNLGAVWIFTRSGSTWTQQGSKLVGTGATGTSGQGTSVALSADGNTLLVGGYGDNGGVGAAWVFTRSGGTWTQQGSKLVGTGAVGTSRQGYGVALSADGNTAAVGAYGDNSFAGAVWIFTRSGTTWTQQGAKLTGTGETGASHLGTQVAMSADGNTVLAGGPSDNTNIGGGWVFTRSGSSWTEQGTPLIGTGAAGAASQGYSVALSADGSTALLGGVDDGGLNGAMWVFTRSNSTWTQSGTKHAGTGATSSAEQGYRVAISSDGSTAIEGGGADFSNVGAVWVFTK